jgi:hypothetical protein
MAKKNTAAPSQSVYSASASPKNTSAPPNAGASMANALRGYGAHPMGRIYTHRRPANYNPAGAAGEGLVSMDEWLGMKATQNRLASTPALNQPQYGVYNPKGMNVAGLTPAQQAYWDKVGALQQQDLGYSWQPTYGNLTK